MRLWDANVSTYRLGLLLREDVDNLRGEIRGAAGCGLDEPREEVEPKGLGEADGGRERDVDLAVQRLADIGPRRLHPRGEFRLRDAQLLHPKEQALEEHLPVSIHCPHDAAYCTIYDNAVASAVPPSLRRQYSLSVPKPADKCIQSPQTATLFRKYVPYWKQSSTPIFVSLSA